MELLSLILLVLFALAIVILWTRGIFARDLTQALKRVNQQEQELQDKANILEERISQMEQEDRAKRKQAEAEAQQLLREGKSQAMNIRTAAIEEAKHRARQLLSEAEQGRSKLKSEVAKELNGRIIQRTCESLQALLPAENLRALHSALVKRMLESLKQLDKSAARDSVARVMVTTGQPFSEEEKCELNRAIADVLGVEVPLEISTDSMLVAGCVIRIGPTIMDGSLLNQLSHQAGG